VGRVGDSIDSGSRKDEAVVMEPELVLEPSRVRLRANENEKRPDVDGFSTASLVVFDNDERAEIAARVEPEKHRVPFDDICDRRAPPTGVHPMVA
jgi:hypothetical protein